MSVLFKRITIWTIIYLLLLLLWYVFIVVCSLTPNILQWDWSLRTMFLVVWVGVCTGMTMTTNNTYPASKWRNVIYKYFNCDKENM